MDFRMVSMVVTWLGWLPKARTSRSVHIKGYIHWEVSCFLYRQPYLRQQHKATPQGYVPATGKSSSSTRGTGIREGLEAVTVGSV
jgi:hypothetical protein